MKNKIIEESIRSLQQEGLRFSVDTLAEKLKISKKTIYKYFPTKEALASAMYERYYADLRDEIQMLVQKDGPVEEELLRCYFDSAKMVRKEIFNKYSLNRTIGDFAMRHHREVWNTIRASLCPEMTETEAEVYKLILDGAFDRAMNCDVDTALLIGMLRKLK
ncbi:MAG: TetR/AcrR family transcriptional regulator [Oscillospiraceae bacterium]